MKQMSAMLLALLPGVPGLAFAQRPDLQVDPTTIVSADNPGVPHWEARVGVNPRNPGNRIAVSNVGPPNRAGFTAAVYATQDGGKTWQRATQGAARETYFGGTNFTVAFSPAGTAFFAVVDWGRRVTENPVHTLSAPGEAIGTHLYRSSDGGASWGEPLVLAGEHHPIIAVDHSGGPYHGRIYLASLTTFQQSLQGETGHGLALAISTDDALHFDERVIRLGTAPNAGLAFDDMLVTPDGVLALVYGQALPPAAGEHDHWKYWIVTSTNGGRSFSEPRLIAAAPAPREGAWPELAVDRSGGVRHGHLYFAYRTEEAGKDRVMLTRSADLGITWSPAVHVSAEATDGEQNISQLAVSANGTVGVAWYDFDGPVYSARTCFRERFAASLDGGLSFLPSVVVRAVPACPGLPGNRQLMSGAEFDVAHAGITLGVYGQDSMNGGDTQGLAGLDGGGFHLVWSSAEAGRLALASTTVHVTSAPLGRDVSDQLHVALTDPVIDTTARTVAMGVTVTNLSQRPLAGSLVLVLTGFPSAQASLRAVNADGGPAGIGARWMLAAEQAGGSLAPGARTRPVHLMFHYESSGKEGILLDDVAVRCHILEASAPR